MPLLLAVVSVVSFTGFLYWWDRMTTPAVTGSTAKIVAVAAGTGVSLLVCLGSVMYVIFLDLAQVMER